MLSRNRVIGLVLIAVLLLTAAPTVFGAFSPEVFVIDQSSVDDMVTVTRATIGDAGWVVIHADENGAPGPVIGYSPIPAGINANVKVAIDPAAATDVLYAMLHVDKGEAGVFDFPGADAPVMRNDKPVTKSFALIGQESTVVKLLASDERFSTLASAVEAAGLTDTLRQAEAVTIFAPSNEAFAALDQAVLSDLLADPAQLSEVLLYHVVPDVVMSADITDGAVDTLQGSPVMIAVNKGAVTVNGAAVSEADLTASNGVVHVIDQVLLPPSEEDAGGTVPPRGGTVPPAAAAELPATIVDAAAADSSLSKLANAITATGLDEALVGTGPFTLFAPNNAAFDALPKEQLAALLADPQQLSALLQHHVLSSAVTAEEITDGMNAAALDGKPLTFAVKDGSVSVNDAKVVAADIAAGNGVVHIIDQVLLPQNATAAADTSSRTNAAAATAPADGKSIAAVAAEAGNFTTLLAAVKAAGLEDALSGAGAITLFAPTDKAFAALPAGALDALLADPQALKNVLLYHVVLEQMTAEQLAAAGIATSAQGSLLVFATQGDQVSVNSVPVVMTDIEADNGMIQVIDSVLLPPNADAAQAAAATKAPTEVPAAAVVAAAAPTATSAPAATPTKAATATSTTKPTATNTTAPTATNTVTPTATSTPVPTNTNTPKPTATNTATNTPVPTATNTPKPTATNTATSTPVPTATNTPKPTATNTATNTPVPTATNTPKPTATNTSVPTATNTTAPTATNTATSTPEPTATNTATNTPVPTATNTATNTAVPTATSTPEPTETNTPAPTATSTTAPTATNTATSTPEPTATNTTAPTATSTAAPEVVAAVVEATPTAMAVETATLAATEVMTTAEATAEATIEATTAVTVEVTMEATTEATAEATMEAVAEATLEATAAMTMEVSAEMDAAATPAAGATKTPAEMPTSGGELNGGSLTLLVVAGVLAMLMGGAYVTRRRPV